MSRHYFHNSGNQRRNCSPNQRRCNGASTCDNTAKLDDPTMIIDAADASSSVDDVHTKELRRIFDSCDDDRDGALTVSGLERLCEELRLDDHKEYILGQLLPQNCPGAARTITFDLFKFKFIQLLPELVDFSSAAGTKSSQKIAVASTTSAIGRNDARQTGANGGTTKGNYRARLSINGQNPSQKPVITPRRKFLVDGGMETVVGDFAAVASDQDTSNDILSEFSDDERRLQRSDHAAAVQKRKSRSSLGSDSAGSSNASSANQSPPRVSEDLRMEGHSPVDATAPAPTITASDVEQILKGLGLADRGYLGRYEFRILCQHLGLNGLSASELNGLFNQLDKDSDGRIAVDDFLLVCPGSSSPSPAAVVAEVPQLDGLRQDSFSRRVRAASGDPLGKDECGKRATNDATCETSTVNGAGTGVAARDDSSNGYAILTVAFGKRVEGMKNLRTRAVALLESLDESRTGHAKRDDVIQYWENLGVENGCDILKSLRFPEKQRWIDLKELSAALDQGLCEAVERDPILTAAFLTFKADVFLLRESLDESQAQALHYLRELQQLNQRNATLVEEMDQSQHNLEVKARARLKELEEKHRFRVNSLETKFREERDQLHAEIREKDEVLRRFEQAEGTSQNRLRQLDKDNAKLRSELDDLNQMLKEIEELNRDLRQALKDAASVKTQQRRLSSEEFATQFLKNFEAGQSYDASGRPGVQPLNGDYALRKVTGSGNGMAGNRSGLVINRSMTAETNPTCIRCASTSSTPAKKRPEYTPPSTSVLLKRRRLQLNPNGNVESYRTRVGQSKAMESSDFESEPEPIIFKPKFKRPLTKRQRLALIANRENTVRSTLQLGNALFASAPADASSSSSSTPTDAEQIGSVGSFSQKGVASYHVGTSVTNLVDNYRLPGNTNQDIQFHHLAALERKIADDRKFYAHELKARVAAMEEEHAREISRLLDRFEREKEQLKNECKRELEALLHSAISEKRAALEQQEYELKKQYDSQKRDADIKWTTERNVMERKFAEEKMEMMERLQNDFEAELNRLRSSISSKSRDNSASPSVSLRLEQILQENVQLAAQLESLRSDFRDARSSLDTERGRCAKLDGRVAELQNDSALWRARCDELSGKNTSLREQIGRLDQNLRDVSMEFATLQQRASELAQRHLEEAASRNRVSSSDVDVQTDRSSMLSVKDESIQLDLHSAIGNANVSPVDQKTLAKSVEELELLLQNCESGFEEELESEEFGEIETEYDPAIIKAAYRRLRKRLTKAQAKFKEIRVDLVGETAVDKEIRLSDKDESPRDNAGPDCVVGAIGKEDAVECDPTVNGIQERSDDLEDDFLDDDENVEDASSVIIAHVAERLRDENVLLKARLSEQKRLTGQLTDRLQQQMRDTVKVSEVAQKLFARCRSMESEQTRK